jgi:heme/copper-type cytochrome/quinol oxidase subunit 3
MFDSKPTHRPHPATATVGMWLFLASLTMLFGASMLGYALIRARSTSPQLHSLHLPRSLWISTALMLAASFTLQHALGAVRRERQLELRRHLVMTCIFAAAFIVIQTPALLLLLREHRALRDQGMHLYGLIFFLILLHALHVLGGIIGLGVTTRHAFAGRYDHESHAGVKHAAMYWHFLDVVWIIMYGGLAIAG